MRQTVSAAVQRWGRTLLEAGAARICDTEALGLDETLFWHRGRRSSQRAGP